MKKLFLLLLIMTSCIIAKAQFMADLAALRSQNNTQITTQTGFHAVTHTIEGNIIDTTLGMIGKLFTMMSSTGLDLETVLTNGNTADQNINLSMSTDRLFYTENTFSGAQATLRPNLVVLRKATGVHDAFLSSSTLTSDQSYTLPDESGSLVTHTTKDDVIVGTLGGSNVWIRNNGSVYCRQGATVAVSMLNGVNGALAIRDGADGFIGTLFSIPFTGALTANRALYFPDESGSIVTHLTKSAITVDDGTNSSSMGPSYFRIFNNTPGLLTELDNTHVKILDGSGNVFASLNNAGSQGTLVLKDISPSIFAVTLKAATLTGNHGLLEPDHDGTIATNDGLPYASAPLVGAPSVVITHGLSFTPTRVVFVPTDAASGGALQGYWISAINPTTFTVNFAAPFTGNLNGYWQAWP